MSSNVLKFVPLLLLPFILYVLNIFFFNLEFIELIKVFFWYLFFFLTGLLTYPLLKLMLPDLLDDAKYALSKIVGFLFVGILTWYLGRIGFSFSRFTTIISFCLILGPTLWIVLRKKVKPTLDTVDFVTVETLFAYVWTLFMLISSFRPDLLSGEKPMDISILSFLSKNSDYPIQDPWAANVSFNYYYFGYFIFSRPINLFGIIPGVGYHLSLSTIVSLTSVASFFLYRILNVKRFIAVALAILSVFITTPASYHRLIKHGYKLNGSYFWELTRTFESNGAFAEYPLWSFLFGDFHPHVITYPFIILAICFFIRLIIFAGKSTSIYDSVLFGVFLGATLVISSWDAIAIFLLMIPIISLLLYWFRKKLSGLVFRTIIFQSLISLICLFVIYLPIFFSYLGGRGLSVSFLNNEVHSWNGYFLQYGYLLYLLPMFLIKYWKQEKNESVMIFFLLFVGGCFIVLFTQNFIIIDSINTLFKLGTNLGLLVSLFIPYFILRLMVESKSKFLNCGLLFFVGLLCGGVYLNMVTAPFLSGKPTLNGSAALKRYFSSEEVLVKWINKNIKIPAVIVEKGGESYDSTVALVASHTGMLSFLGPTGHVGYGRNVDPVIISERSQLIRDLYVAEDLDKVYQKFLTAGVNYIKVGPIEKKEFGQNVTERFSTRPDLFSKVYNGVDISLFVINR